MIAITPGDAAGIGAEIILKALSIFPTENFIIYCDSRVIERAMAIPSVPERDINIVGDDFRTVAGKWNVRNAFPLDPDSYRPGAESALCGRASYEWIASACRDALYGKVSLLCTGPVNKVSLRLADVPFIGHTEMLAHLTGCPDPLTMFQVDSLRIFFLSRHVSLRKAIDLVTFENLVSTIPRCIDELAKLGVGGPLAVAGLNPHCGENGLFGDEEEEVKRAVSFCRKQGLDVVGPLGADSVFHQCLCGRFAAVLSLYHDQGHIAAKTYDFNRTVSLTLGMKVLRISVDHGTAFDIAGRGTADERGMVEVLRLAMEYEEKRRKTK